MAVYMGADHMVWAGQAGQGRHCLPTLYRCTCVTKVFLGVPLTAQLPAIAAVFCPWPEISPFYGSSFDCRRSSCISSLVQHTLFQGDTSKAPQLC
jgi:hypothetical protein